MSLFQCENCGCCENTALAWRGHDGPFVDDFDWSGIEDRKGKQLCSACGPTRFFDGAPTGSGKWHDEFERTFLPMGMFVTNSVGNLAHKKTGETDFEKYSLTPNAN